MRALVLSAALLLFTLPALAQTVPVPAPLPAGAVAVTAEQNGRSIEAAVGAQAAIQVQRSGSIGANWTVSAKPDFLDDASQLSGPTATATGPVLGAPSWQVFVFAVAVAGSGEVKLEKHDRSGAVVDSFTVTTNATAQ
jgi:hypothetical protein